MTPALARTWMAAAALALLAASPTPSIAADAAPGARTCSRQDLVGAWDVVRIATPPASPIALDARDPSYYPHQRFVFQDNGIARHVTSTVPIAPVARQVAAGPLATTWELDGQGFLTLRHGSAPPPEPALCGYLIQADPRSAGAVRAGDVLLTYYRDGRPVLFRHLRRQN